MKPENRQTHDKIQTESFEVLESGLSDGIASLQKLHSSIRGIRESSEKQIEDLEARNTELNRDLGEIRAMNSAAREESDRDFRQLQTRHDQLLVAVLRKESEKSLFASRASQLEEELKGLREKSEKDSNLLSMAHLNMEELRAQCIYLRSQLDLAEMNFQNKQAQAHLLMEKAKAAEAKLHEQTDQFQAKLETERTQFRSIAENLRKTAAAAMDRIPLDQIVGTFSRAIEQLSDGKTRETPRIQETIDLLKHQQAAVQKALSETVTALGRETSNAALFEDLCAGESAFFSDRADDSKTIAS